MHGERYLRAQCKPCKREVNKKYQRLTHEHDDRYRAMQRARRRALQRLAKLNEEGYKVLYAEELTREGVTLTKYVGPR